ASNGAFPDFGQIPVFAALLNSVVTTRLLEVLSPTLNNKSGDIGRIPVPKAFEESGLLGSVRQNSEGCLELARADWDNFESSWDFRDLTLLRTELKGATLAASWQNWKAKCDSVIRRMRELETENNRLFIAAYGLDGELQPEVPEEQITLA